MVEFLNKTILIRKRFAFGALVLLTLIHLVLPYTPANKHDGSNTILIGAATIGVIFLGLTVLFHKKRSLACLIALVFFMTINGIAAYTGASELMEGWPIKLIFSLSLLAGILKP